MWLDALPAVAQEAQEAARAVRVALGAALDLVVVAGLEVALGVAADRVDQEAGQVLGLVRVAALVAGLMAVALGQAQGLEVDPMALMDPMDQEAVALVAVPVVVLGVVAGLAALALMALEVDLEAALGLMAVGQALAAVLVSPASVKAPVSGSGSRPPRNGSRRLLTVREGLTIAVALMAHHQPQETLT